MSLSVSGTFSPMFGKDYTFLKDDRVFLMRISVLFRRLAYIIMMGEKKATDKCHNRSQLISDIYPGGTCFLSGYGFARRGVTGCFLLCPSP